MWTSNMLPVALHPSTPRDKTRLVVRKISWLLVSFVLLVTTNGIFAADGDATAAAGRSLKNISYSSLGGDRVQIKLTFSSAAPEPVSFTVDNPARIALDLPDTGSAVPKKAQDISIGVAQSISAVEVKGRTRVVLNLVELVPYQARVDGNDLFLTLESGATAQPGDQASTTMTAAAKRADGSQSISKIDFRRGKDGAGQVLVSVSDPAVSIDVRQQSNRVIIDLPGVSLPDSLLQRFDVVDFATPVQTMDVTRLPDKVRIVVAASGDFEYLAYQADKLLTVELRAVTKEEAAELSAEKEYTGQRLTFNFQSIEIRAVLQLIADFTDRNLVASDSVQGTITLRLKNVPWDQALDIILKTKGLAMRETGNVMLVAPAGELTTILQQEQKVAEAAPLRSELIQINYAKASEVAGLLRSESSSVMSARGSIAIDERTNTMIVQDTTDKIDEMRQLVAKLDIPVRQVLIESRIVIANNDFNKELGIRFGGSAVNTTSSGANVATAGNIGASAAAAAANTPVNGMNVNLPVASPGGSIALSVLDTKYLLDLELSALQAEGRGEIISSPRIITANQKEATIQQGVQIPYQEASSSGATTVSFKDAVLSLKVTPQITPDDRVILDLTVNKDSVGERFSVSGITGITISIPSIDTRQVVTQVLVNNGETVVLGGVYEQEQRTDTTKVPFFGDLPIVGALFTRTARTDDKEELLIFVTPKILKETLTAN